ncbi:MAG: hypothetical protein JRF72_14075 [Deltaproteobacteria bacterium]|jgi:hypothetical protein|nr:hypothetical protein [Deltaproteobacteria bacterium]
MKKVRLDKSLIAEHLGCFGQFDLEDPVCKTYCAVNLRCAIERDQNDRIEILQELAFSDEMYLKIQ